MDFLADVETPCEDCRGRRYQPRVLEVRWNGKTIADVLDMTALEARFFFRNHRRLAAPLAVLDEVGLGYLVLGQTIATLSDGESRRLKLAVELGRPAAGEVLYLFDEPTAGLHAAGIEKLMLVFARLLREGHTWSSSNTIPPSSPGPIISSI